MSFADDIDQFGDATALITESGDDISYRQLVDLSDQLQNYLKSLPERQLIAIEFSVSSVHIAAYLAALRNKTPAILIDPALTDSAKEAIYQNYQVAAIVDAEGNWLPTGQHNQCRPDLALIVPTSGSTGAAKAVMLSLAQLHANARDICAFLPIESTSRAISMLPFHYVYGLSVLNTHLFNGASLVLTSQPVMSALFWQQFKEHRVTSLSGVPMHFDIFRKMRLTSKLLPSLTYITQAGGKLSSATADYIKTLKKHFNVPVYLMYGQTEATARIAYLPPDKFESHHHCIGVAIPNGALFLRHCDNNQPIDLPDVEGELCYTGPNVMLGYASTAADLSSATTLTELRTGDLAVRTKEGLFRIVGRLARFIKIHGKRLQLDSIEDTCRKHYADTIVTGEDDKLFIALRQASDDDIKQLQQFVRAHFKLHPSLFEVVNVPEWPTLSNGKLDYIALQAKFGQ